MFARFILWMGLIPVVALAAPMTITIQATANGTLNGVPFSDRLVTFTFKPDTTDALSNEASVTSIICHLDRVQIGGITYGSYDPLQISVNSSTNEASVSFLAGPFQQKVSFFQFVATALNGYNLRTSLAASATAASATQGSIGLTLFPAGELIQPYLTVDLLITGISNVTMTVDVPSTPPVTTLPAAPIPTNAYLPSIAVNLPNGTYALPAYSGLFFTDPQGFNQTVINPPALDGQASFAAPDPNGNVVTVGLKTVGFIGAAPPNTVTTAPNTAGVLYTWVSGVPYGNIAAGTSPSGEAQIVSVQNVPGSGIKQSTIALIPQLKGVYPGTYSGKVTFVGTDGGSAIGTSPTTTGTQQAPSVIQTGQQSVTGMTWSPYGLIFTAYSVGTFGVPAGILGIVTSGTVTILPINVPGTDPVTQPANPINPLYTGCGHVAFIDNFSNVDSYNINSKQTTVLAQAAAFGPAENAPFSLFNAGARIGVVQYNPQIATITPIWNGPCQDVFTNSQLWTEARSASPDTARPLAVTPAAGARSGGIVMGPDGAMWYAAPSANGIGRIDGNGAIDSFATLSAGSGPLGFAIGSDGNYWVTETAANKIQQTTPFGVSTEFGGLSAGSAPANIIPGPDGALWFNESGTGKIGRMTTAGTVTEFAANAANSLAAGPDGAVWYTETGTAKIGRITTSGAITECTLANVATQIAAGPDGAMWFTEAAANKIGQVTTDGNCTVTEYSTGLTANAGLDAITLGSDGSMWFTEDNVRQVAHIDPVFQAIIEYPLPAGLASTAFNGIGVGIEGGLWITGNAGEVVRNMLPANVVASQITVGTNPPGQPFTFDGTTFTSAQTFSLPLGINSTIAVTLPAASASSRDSFLGWSDGAATLSETITEGAPPSMHIANLATQYLLSMAASPAAGGSLTANPSSPDGFYNAGTTVQLTPIPKAGYTFTGWSGDASGSAVPLMVSMSVAHSVTANFAILTAGVPAVTGTLPTSGSGMSQSFTFTYSDSAGAQNLSVVNVLINKVLDGRNACYLAYVVSTSTLVLVDDAGDAGGPYAGSVALGNPRTVIQNSQCAVSLTSAAASGNTLTLVLSIAFKAAFGGNRIQYLAAGDAGGNNTDWQGVGVWQATFTPSGTIAVVSASPARGAAAAGTPETLTFTWTDTKGASDFGVVNVLVNRFIDGRQACYLAYAAAGNTLYLVDDAGDAGGPFAGGMVLNGSSAAIQNSQCSVSGTGTSASMSGNTLTLVLNVTFKSGLSGNRIVWAAGRDGAGLNNTDWQSMGTWSVQ